MDTLATLAKARSQPLYDRIELKNFHPMMEGAIRVRVNLTKSMQEQMGRLQESPDSDAKLEFAVRLIPRADDSDETLTLAEFKEFTNAASDNDDVLFATWIIERVFDCLIKHIKQRPLSSTPLASS